MIWEVLISFPVNLLWGILLFQLYVRPNGRYAVYAASALVIIAGFFIPAKAQIIYWNPSGLIAIVSASLLHLLMVHPNEALQKALNIELPSRKEVRDLLMKTNDQIERQKIYVKIIKEYAHFWHQKASVLTGINTRFSLLIFTSVSGGLFFFWLASYFWNPDLISMIRDQFELMNKNFMQITGKTDENLIDVAKVFTMYMRLGPAVIFIEVSLIILLFLFILRKIFAQNAYSLVILGYITLFQVNEKAIWAFIIAGLLTLGAIYYPVPAIIEIASINLLAILAFVYFIQGLGILNLFLTVRLLPANWILFTVFAFGVILPQAVVFVLFFLTLIGLGDFWFDFRNKALQPRAIMDNDDY